MQRLKSIGQKSTTIRLPSMRWEGASELQEVEHWEDLQRRLAVEKLGRYFRREFHYDFIPYYATANSDNSKNVVFLWLGEDYDRYGRKAVAYGVVEFRPCPYPELIKEGCEWELAWIWFHPYERGKGHLSSAWDYFQKRFGNFWVQHPLSFGMEEFLKKHPETLELPSE